MILTLISVGLLLLGLLLLKAAQNSGSDTLAITGVLCSIIGGCVTLCCAICIGMASYNDNQYLQSVEQMKSDMKARKSLDPIENAALTQKVLELNADIIERRYSANSLLTNWFSIDEMRTIETISLD